MGLLVFNWVGYRLFTSLLELRSNDLLEQRLDSENYNESQLLSVKVPVSHLSYYTPSTQYERATGHVYIDGISYSFVKRRILNDSLELLYIPNPEATQWHKASGELFRNLNDIANTNNSKKADTHKGFSKIFSTDNFVDQSRFEMLASLAISLSSDGSASGKPCSLLSLTVEQPPDSLL